MRAVRVATVLLVSAWLAPSGVLADSATGLGGKTVAGDSGASVYQHVCQGCHMPGGAGAVGAGAIPRLAGDRNLTQAGYPVAMVLNGHGGMPWFNGLLSAQQIADVVNYVRTHFGNDYKDPVTLADVTAVQGPAPIMER